MRILLCAGVFVLGSVLSLSGLAQADGLVAYVPEKPLERTADSERIGFVNSPVAGKVEALIPMEADRVDILNARGNVKRSYEAKELESFSIGDLRPGTWTLRVHAADKMMVRRFVVMHRGSIVWSPSGPVRRR
ncbi:MAG: hypothetical protein IPH05_09195 [Flavobacteriales bacterium]|jgi:hypothetical protein|nr:hypothetical protein [Flavobacteriales bacterium]MBK6883100.1 hypothetical protein [Flavobacteriales bacterium]MBK7103136.1 hypothetical protein [Flavobacteriales bacterium]MBK7112888.1 hypothetical protein [Flavobacteriales bacterium]MBK7481512.1 hypothetical protein [Flavobacteriales bacterium]